MKVFAAKIVFAVFLLKAKFIFNHCITNNIMFLKVFHFSKCVFHISKKHKISEIHLLDISYKKEKNQGLRGI